jgi:hypothetical protein
MVDDPEETNDLPRVDRYIVCVLEKPTEMFDLS